MSSVVSVPPVVVLRVCGILLLPTMCVFPCVPPHSVKSLAGVPVFMRAKSGQHGSKQGKHGANGSDVIVDVPLGTVVYQLLPDAAVRGGDGGGGQGDDVWQHIDDAEVEVWGACGDGVGMVWGRCGDVQGETAGYNIQCT